jgi:SAM-dependent methyltransferase
MNTGEYVHGYSEREGTRLQDQSRTLEELLHHDTVYPAGARVLEAGCGVGAQTVILARRSPLAQFSSLDVSPASLEAAKYAAQRAGLANVAFEIGDLFQLRFADGSFDHVFVCFVLEHLSQPQKALTCVARVLKPGGTLTVIEGDHGSSLFHPHSAKAWRTIQCLIDLEARSGGDALIGRRLFPLLTGAGFRSVTVSPRFVYADASRPDWVEGFTRKTYIAMVEGVRDVALAAGMMDAASWDEGIADLQASAGPDGVFCYTFFKGTARK